MSTIGGKKIATRGSNHVMPGPTPAMSLGPAQSPAGPVPSPFAYLSRSATGAGLMDHLTVAGEPVLVPNQSSMAVEAPGNSPAQATGADMLTHVADAKTSMFTGVSSVQTQGHAVCCTGDKGAMNVPAPQSKVSQCCGTLVMADMLWASGADMRSFAAGKVYVIDPVSVASGEVCDEEIDARLEGLIPLVWKRLYGSGRHRERTPFGRGGWTHSLHQWIEPGDEGLTLRDEDAISLPIAPPEGKGVTFHRGRRLEVRRSGEGYEVRSLATRLTRVFQPHQPHTAARARLTAIRDDLGNRVELVYEGDRLARVTGTSGRDLKLLHDNKGRIVRAEVWARGAAQRAVAYAYDGHGDLVRVTDPLGHESLYAYDGEHRMAGKTLPTGLSFRYEYDEAGRCVRGVGDGGLHPGDLDYDLTTRTTTLTGTPSARVFQWDERGNVTLQKTPDGSVVKRTTYDEDGYVLAVEDAAGERHVFEHDARGNTLSHTDPHGRCTRWEYSADLLVKRTFCDDRVTVYAYDDRGSLVAVTYPSGVTLLLTRDGRGRITAVLDKEGVQAAFEYDEQDNIVRDTGRLGDAIRFYHDPLGHLLAVTDALGRTVRYARDADQRIVGVQLPDGAVTRVTRDGLGRVVSELDAAGGVTARTYGGTRALRQVTRADGQTWEIAYDAVERPRVVKNPRQETWELRYDRLGRVVEQRTFDGRILRYQYALSGHLSRIENADGTWQTFAVDVSTGVREERSSHGTIRVEATPERAVRVVDEVPGKTITTSERDPVGRLVAETQDGLTIRYFHDGQNRRVARVMPGGETTRYAYDAVGRLVAVEHEGREVALAYDLAGNEVRRLLHWCGVDILSAYDPLDRLARSRVLAPRGQAPAGAPRGVLVERSFGYDARGWLRRVEDSLRGTSTYEHDAAGRLLAVGRGHQREVIDYDAAGSVVGIHAGIAGAPWVMRPGNVLVESPHGELAYDADRRRTRRSTRLGETRYLWDCRGRLREVRLPGGARALYTYDARGRRVKKELIPPPHTTLDAPEVPTRTVRYLWDGPALAAEIDSERGSRIFVHAPGTITPILHQEGDEVFAYVGDHLGVAKELIDEKGAVAWAAAHSAWGAVVGVQAPATAWRNRARPPGTPFRLLGHYHDEETGLSYAHHRYFEPETARWLSPDPLGLAGGTNPAAFNGSPAVHVDPFGLLCVLGNPASDGDISSLLDNRYEAPGYYDVVLHGSSDSASKRGLDGSGDAITAAQLAKIIQDQEDYEGQPIRLLSCSTGKDKNGFAKDFADEMGKTVVAPNRDLDPREGAINDPYMKTFTPNPDGPKTVRTPPPDPAKPAMVPPGGPGGGFSPPMTPQGETPAPPALVPKNFVPL